MEFTSCSCVCVFCFCVFLLGFFFLVSSLCYGFFYMVFAWCLVSSMFGVFWHASTTCSLLWQGFLCGFGVFLGVVLVPRVWLRCYFCPGFLWWYFCVYMYCMIFSGFSRVIQHFFLSSILGGFFSMLLPHAIIGHFNGFLSF